MTTNWSYEEATDQGLLILQGEVTIQHVGDLKKALADAVRNAKLVTVDVSSTTAVDVAGVQLLCAGHRFSTSYGKKMHLWIADNKRFADFLAEYGVSL